MASRATHLQKLLRDVASGRFPVKDLNIDRAKRFLEAICAQDDRAICIERLFAKQPCLDVLRCALRIDTSVNYINRSIAAFLKYISDPSIKQISGGQFLEDLIDIIVDPPTLWNALIDSLANGSLDGNATYSTAWLLLEPLSSPSNKHCELVEAATSVIDFRSFLSSTSHDVRVLGYQIQRISKIKASNGKQDPDKASPGGRHDNDFVDYRRTAIFPTADEFISDTQPFYRLAKEVAQAESDDRIGVHLDNQFRLLREDMLAELRDDVRVAIGKKKGRRSPVVLKDLSLAGIECGQPKKWKSCALKLHCKFGMEKFAKMSTAERKTCLQANPRSLKHQSFGCLSQGDQIVAFAVLDRDEAGLLEDPPATTLNIYGDDALKSFLLALKAEREPVDYLQVDTPFFAYEPVLKCLQKMQDIPLAQFILGTNSDEASETTVATDRAITNKMRVQGSSIIQDLSKPTSPSNLIHHRWIP